MAGVCPVCGAHLELEKPKFCPECGSRLSPQPEIQVDRPEPAPIQPDQVEKSIPGSDACSIGAKLEDVVAEIFQKDGYATQRRVTITGRGNYPGEIDIVAERNGEKIAIECKNLTKTVGIMEVRDFAQKLEELGPGWRGVFIACNDLTPEADDFAASRNIEVLDPGEIKEKWFALSMGRTGLPGETIRLEYALPVVVDYETVTFLNLVNKDKVQVRDAKLVFHPYYRVRYTYHATINDPAMNVHTFDDKGIVILDALDGKILNPPVVGKTKAIGKALKNIVSSVAHEENTRFQKLLQEICKETPVREYTITIGKDYRIVRLMAETTPGDAEKFALDYIVEKNIHSVEFEVNGLAGRKETKKREFVPRREDITCTTDAVLVPKWTVHFDVLGFVYTREAFACSGELLEDTLENCPLHAKFGSLAVKKKTGAVCEVCGRAYCREHILSCSSCGKWLCENHAVSCSACGRDFCSRHTPMICPLCSKPLCGGCVTACPGCGRTIGANHLIACEECGQKFCPDCLIKEGVIRKKRICRNCSEERK
ncbi:MAG: restriction endonuclease [Methanomicrobiales archaeon]|nr:restriction endonuclease [Methanomicrobiales archaeon]